MRISNSFSEGEIAIMEFILQTLLRGGSAQMATRSKDYASLCRKVAAMKAKVEEKKRDEILGKRAPEKSSVGEVEAIDASDASDEALEDVG